MDPYSLYPGLNYAYPQIQMPIHIDAVHIDHHQPQYQLQVHAPVPISSQPPLLYAEFHNEPFTPSGDVNVNQLPTLDHGELQLGLGHDPATTMGHTIMYHTCDGVLGNATVPVAAPIIHQTFPTPSELMLELQAASSRGSLTPTPATTALGRISSPGPGPSDDFATGRDCDIPPAAETARNARRRAMTQSIGFVPTDPDTISSHEKKRHYLECIEQYILYLHEQFELVGEKPPSMDKVTTYRGLSSRSIRTLLVHMEHNTSRLNVRTVDEEQRFLRLRNEIEGRYK